MDKFISSKKIILCVITSALGLLMVFGLFFPVTHFNVADEGTIFKGSFDGFRLMSLSVNLNFPELKFICALLIMQMAFASVCLTIGIAGLFLLKNKTYGRACALCMTGCWIFGIIDMLIGVFFSLSFRFYAETADITFYTLFYITFILVSLFCVAEAAIKAAMKDVPLSSIRRKKDDGVDLLIKYKELLDNGAITQEEYDRMKARYFSEL